ncbi:hypothetical protein [Pantoea sp.]|uniref:hypothetical protein n=1 Tax=Pantoea sp. TaxID=69393 RepID=UPI0028B164C2|nr:hypothetical protein [Pantoea sp.]
MHAQGLTEQELRVKCRGELGKMAARIRSGEQIPAPRVQLEKLYVPASNVIMVKLTQLIPTPLHSVQARQLMLAIITLAEKQAAAPEGHKDRLHAVSMYARESPA